MHKPMYAPAMLAMLAMSMLWVNYPFASAGIYMQWDSMYLSIQLCKCYTMLSSLCRMLGVISSLCRMLWECYPACAGWYGSTIQPVQDAMGALSSLYAVLCSLCRCYIVLPSLYAVLSSAIQLTQVLCITRYRGGVYEAMGAI